MLAYFFKECPDGTYGDNCTRSCSSTCANPVCDKFSDTGACVGGCIPGYRGEACREGIFFSSFKNPNIYKLAVACLVVVKPALIDKTKKPHNLKTLSSYNLKNN